MIKCFVAEIKNPEDQQKQMKNSMCEKHDVIHYRIQNKNN